MSSKKIKRSERIKRLEDAVRLILAIEQNPESNLETVKLAPMSRKQLTDALEYRQLAHLHDERQEWEEVLSDIDRFDDWARAWNEVHRINREIDALPDEEFE